MNDDYSDTEALQGNNLMLEAQLQDCAEQINSLQALFGLALKELGRPLETDLDEMRQFCDSFALQQFRVAETNRLRFIIIPIQTAPGQTH